MAHFLDMLEHAVEPTILAVRRGELSQEHATRLIGGKLLRREEMVQAQHATGLDAAPHAEKMISICRQVFTRRASWALFTIEWMDSLAKMISSLIPKGAPPRVLEVACGQNLLAAPMRARGLEWVATDSKISKTAVSPPAERDALDAVREMAPALVFWSWWSRTPEGEVATDRLVAEQCCERGIPVIFVGEPRGGSTGSAALWDGPWTIQPLAGVPLHEVGGFRDLPSWGGFRDCTWLLSGSQ